MAGIEHYAQDVAEIETELVRKGIALGLDWSDETEVRALAHAAINNHERDVEQAAASPGDYQLMAKVELYGLAAVMLKTMQKSADVGILSHGGPVWKAFAKALWTEAGLSQQG
ncbi:hypothetical protein [Azonexus sp. IMCC34839]|uniref:hypothetical protein n=1 Tax=Azonexus sp. IMCC34839 TaxID=3133695 RepID=UPI003999886F